MRSLRVLGPGAVLLVLASCANPVGPPPPGEDPVLPEVPTPEALIIAAVLSGELRGPVELAREITRDLDLVRSAGVAPQLEVIGFEPPWIANQITLGLTPEAAAAVAAGEYDAWDELNAELGLARIDDRGLARWGYVTLAFEDPFNARVLAAQYEGLPGVRFSIPDALGFDGPGLYPRLDDAVASYLFRNAWGDCWAGCIDEEFWYFEVTSGRVEFLGHFDPASAANPPVWWPRAQRNLDLFETF